MSAQIRRAATSIAANIAEGHGRETPGAFVQFLRMSQGSLKELETLVLLAMLFLSEMRTNCRGWYPNVMNLGKCFDH
jgi:four helix bundle protein